jgi:hypothetical protein
VPLQITRATVSTLYGEVVGAAGQPIAIQPPPD